MGGVERRIRARRGQYGFQLPAGGRGQHLGLSVAAGSFSLAPAPPLILSFLGVISASCIHIVDSGLRGDGEVAPSCGTRADLALRRVCVFLGEREVQVGLGS